MTESCEGCRFWGKMDNGSGKCMKNAPIARPVLDYLSAQREEFERGEQSEVGALRFTNWPETFSEDWCGEFQPRAAEPPPGSWANPLVVEKDATFAEKDIILRKARDFCVETQLHDLPEPKGDPWTRCSRCGITVQAATWDEIALKGWHHFEARGHICMCGGCIEEAVLRDLAAKDSWSATETDNDSWVLCHPDHRAKIFRKHEGKNEFYWVLEDDDPPK